jgi:hypothetical protein
VLISIWFSLTTAMLQRQWLLACIFGTVSHWISWHISIRQILEQIYATPSALVAKHGFRVACPDYARQHSDLSQGDVDCIFRGLGGAA